MPTNSHGWRKTKAGEPEKMIPKKIHHMSPDGNLSARERECINSFQLQNPDYEMVSWTDKTVDEFIQNNYPDNFYKMWLENTKGGIHRRGYLKKWDSSRLYILNKEGGFYTDNDCYCLKSLDTLINNSLVIRRPLYRWTPIYDSEYEFDFTPPHICNAFFGCQPDNPILNEMIDLIIERFNHNPNEHIGRATACLLWGEVLEKRMQDGNHEGVKLLEHYEFMEGIERLPWIEEEKFTNLIVIHKMWERSSGVTPRYKSFPNKIKTSEARLE